MKKFKLFNSGVAILLSMLTLSGCLPHKSSDKHTYKYNPNPDYSNSQTPTNEKVKYNDPNTRISNNNEINSRILNINDNDYNFLVNYIDSTQISYKYEENYHLNEAINAYNSFKKSNNVSHASKLKDLNSEQLYNIIKENNKKYLEEKKNDYVSSFYKEIDDSKLKMYCKYIVEQINYLFNESNEIDKERVLCVLSDLKVFYKADLANAYVNDENCLIVTKSMDVMAAMNPGVNTEEATIRHEATHIVQKNCPHELHSNLNSNVGISYEFKNLKVNSLYFNWLYESSAEMNMCNALNIKNLVYNYYIGYANSLNLSQVLNPNNTYNQIEKLSLQTDLDNLFKTFNAYTDEQKKEILNMMYSLTVVENEPNDFFEEIGINLDSIDEAELKGIKRNLKTSILETITKQFYKNLINNIKNNNASLNDFFFLVTLFENDINFHMDYNLESEYNYNKDFLAFYTEFQKNIFQSIADSNGMNIDDLYMLFSEYCTFKGTYDNKEFNCTLNWLDDDKKALLYKIYNNTKESASEHIIDSYERLTKSNNYSLGN